MWPFDYFKKKREREEREARLAVEEHARQERIRKERTKRDSIEEIVNLATRLNFANNNRSKIEFFVTLDNLSEMLLYSEINLRTQGERVLLNLSANDCQCVGLAFIVVALQHNFTDRDMNSVAAENAYYCLARNFKEKGNTFVAPAIFSLLYNGDTLLKDKLIASWCDMTQKESGMPIGMLLGGNPFTAPHLQDFRDQAIGFKKHIMYFVLKKFFDLDTNEYTIPTDLPYFIPSKNVIASFLQSIKDDATFYSSDIDSLCEKHFNSVYEQCKETLIRY